MYNNYEGNYLEGFILQAKNFMLKSKKYQSFRLRLLGYHDIKSLREFLDDSINILKSLNYGRYLQAQFYSNGSVKDDLDKYLAIDDLLENDNKGLIAIDWTNNLNSVQSKVDKHIELKDCFITLYIKHTIVVCMQNVDLWEDLNEADLAKSLYKVLQLISIEVSKKDYSGFIVIDVKTII